MAFQAAGIARNIGKNFGAGCCPVAQMNAALRFHIHNAPGFGGCAFDCDKGDACGAKQDCDGNSPKQNSIHHVQCSKTRNNSATATGSLAQSETDTHNP
jgi:hypothetical protein